MIELSNNAVYIVILLSNCPTTPSSDKCPKKPSQMKTRELLLFSHRFLLSHCCSLTNFSEFVWKGGCDTNVEVNEIQM